MTRLETRGKQLELTPVVGLNEPLLRPAEAAALLSVRTSWIYEASAPAGCRTFASAAISALRAPTSSAGCQNSA